MTAPNSSTDPAFSDLGFGLNGERRVLLVADMVESVRLMQRHEWETTQRWRSLVQTLVQDVLPAHQGTLVQRRGDGLMLEFETVTGAAAAAFECHRRADAANAGQPGDQHIVLRMGLHQAEVLADGIDLYGAGVQLTHRLAALAQPGETLCTAEVRDELTDGLHASVCDKGERLLPGQEDPVRVYQLQPVGSAPRSLLRWAPESLLPRVAFVAARTYSNPADTAICQMVVTELTAAASVLPLWQVISALSTRYIPRNESSLAHAYPVHKFADFIVEVDLQTREKPVSRLTCIDDRLGTPIWSHDYKIKPSAWISPHDALATSVVATLSHVILAEYKDADYKCTMHHLPGYALLLHAIQLTHRTVFGDAEKAKSVLIHLSERHPRSADVTFWLAKWHFLSAIQGFANPEQGFLNCKEYLQRALDTASGHRPSIALNRHVGELSNPQMAISEDDFINTCSNEPTAWLYEALAQAFSSTKRFATEISLRAQTLSPWDPLKYYFCTFSAQCALVEERPEIGLAFAEAAVKLNGFHLTALQTLMVAQAWCGQMQEAKATAQRYLTLRPNASVSRFVKFHPQSNHPVVRKMATSLIEIGIPK